MEDKFNQGEFEEFLQDQVRNHRMYPGDAVWREIDKNLHGEKRWPALTIAAAMLVSATVLICVYFTPKTNIFTIPVANANTSTLPGSNKTNILNNITSSIPFSKAKTLQEEISSGTPGNVNEVESIAAGQTATIVTKRDIDVDHINIAVAKIHKNNGDLRLPVSIKAQSGSVIQTKAQDKKSDIKNSVSDAASVSTSDEKALPSTATLNNTDKIGVNNTNEHSKDIPVAFYGRKKSTLKNKFSYQIYIAPSVSYRKLLEENSPAKENVGGPVGINFVTDVNKVVRHKPGTGIEVGVSLMYNISERVRLKSGFQFNMRQYSIEAYRSNTELASIALIGNNSLDTINTLAIYRTNNGYYSAQLVNRYYQVSVPVGIEWEVLGNKVVQLNVAGTIQPTYLLNRNAYLLSTNFKNYTESPGIVRQWNINSNIEAFISLKAGDFKWQLGPQLRYQPYSTFIPQYTIKEHLLDYGIKLGLSKTIN